MKTFLLFLSLGFLPIMLFSQVDVKTEMPHTYAKIKQKASDQWPGDFEMQKFTIDKQCTAYNEYIKLIKNNSVPDDIFQQILAGALDKWCDNNWLKCFKENNNDVDSSYGCMGADWEMVVYEMNNQIKAYESLK